METILFVLANLCLFVFTATATAQTFNQILSIINPTLVTLKSCAHELYTEGASSTKSSVYAIIQ